MGYPANVPVRFFKQGEFVVINNKKYALEHTCRNINPVNCRNFICSKCDDSYEKGAGEPNPNFCPNCGAKVLND